MLTFATDKESYRRTGLTLFVAQLFLFVFGLPPFHAGIWVQVEPVEAAMFALATLTCLWLEIGLSKEWLQLQRPFGALWICLMLWVGWQAVATVFALSPWRSWFGPPESGEGMGWYASALLCALLAAPLWQLPSCRKHMLITAAIAIVLLSLLYAAHDDEMDPWRPMRWAAFMAFMAGWLFIAVIASYDIRKWLPFVALAAFCLIANDISGNRTAALLFPYPIIFTGVVLLADGSGYPFFRHAAKVWRWLAIIACIVPVAWILMSQHWQWFPRRTSLGARAEMNQVSLTVMQHEPSRWIAGGGWGRFTDDVFKYGMVEGSWYFHNGDPDPNTTTANGNSFHSHSQPMEALLSLGLPGLLLWFAFPMLVLWRLPPLLFWRIAPMLVAVTALSYFWFPIVHMLAYQSLLWVALCAACAGKTQSAAAPLWPRAALALAGLLMLWSLWQQESAMRYGENLSAAIATHSYNDYSNAMLTDDIRRGGDRMREVFLHYALQYAEHPAGIDEDNAAGWYRNFLRAAQTAADSPRAGARLSNLDLVLQNILLLNLRQPAFAALNHESMLFYPSAVAHLAVTAPWREDLAAPYMLYHLAEAHGDISAEIDLLDRLLAVDSDHRGALWLLGQALLKKPGHEEQGRDMLRRAAALGVERVWPVTDQDLAPFKR